MNTLDFRCTDDNVLSFELLVDGKSLGNLIGSRDTAIPYWIIEDGLPSTGERDPEIRIVCVCSCGEYGCSNAQCRVTHESEIVILHSFDGDVTREGSEREFHFSRPNYDEVMAEIVRKAKERVVQYQQQR